MTQSFNTATSMGRLTLNMLLSLAQFERQVTAERIRDKTAASKREGLWMGGDVPLSYDADGRTLKINAGEAATVRAVYDRYLKLGTVRAVQDRLKAEAAKTRDRETTGSSFQSLLTGKVFDETGDRLTPSHGGTRGGIRHRYYVSHRLIARSGEADVFGWRLPAQMLEGLVLRAAARHLTDPAFSRRAILDATASGLAAARCRIDELLAEEDTAFDRSAAVVALIVRIDLALGQLTLSFASAELASLLIFCADHIGASSLTITTAFTMRRRRVETGLILGNEPLPLVRKQIRNIATALSWIDRIKAGQSQAEIAATDSIPVWRVQQAIHDGFLVPDIIRQVLQGRQPQGLTSKWIFLHPLPMHGPSRGR